jgi:hypothetical protein
VEGSTTIILSTISANSKIVAPSVNVSFNPNSVSFPLLPFAIVDAKWHTSDTTIVVSLIASSIGINPLVFVGDSININVTALCAPGHYVNLKHLSVSSNNNVILDFLSISNRSELCTKCPNGTASAQEETKCPICPSGSFANFNNTMCMSCSENTWSQLGTQGSCSPCSYGYSVSYAKDRCITLTFSLPPPVVLTSFIPFQLPSVFAVDNFNRSMTMNGSILVSLLCSVAKCSAVRKGAIFQTTGMFKDGVVKFDLSAIADDSDSVIGVGYEWALSSTSTRSGNFGLNVLPLGIHTVNSTTAIILGPLPSIASIVPRFVSFSGNTIVTVISSVWEILDRMQVLIPNRTATCSFRLMSITREYVEEAYSVDASHAFSSSIFAKTCIVPQAPPFRFWNVSITLADGRISSNSLLLETCCPNNYFVQNKSCSKCPSSEKGSSFNSLINAASIETCRCSPGSYGTFGFGCKKCPPLEGFECRLADQILPIIRPGYYGDYSLLQSCDENSNFCAALKLCPYGERACPGGGNMLCTQEISECYEGRACSQCCSMFYFESGRCIKCPDPSNTATILAVMMVIVIVFAMLLSTAQTPSLSQSMKYFVIGMNFFQNLNSVSLIGIEWPMEVRQLFDALAYFTFSISSVRPECSFSWSYETRVVVTLLLPLLLSLLVLLIGVVSGVLWCKRILKRIHQLQPNANTNTAHLLNFKSIAACWLHTACFVPFEWQPEIHMWFALSPELEDRWLSREFRSGKQNWEVFRHQYLKSQTLRRVFGVARRLNIVIPSHSSSVVETLHKAMRNAGLTTSFALAVDRGRKLLSGIFSIAVLCFVGTLTSAFSVFKCDERDGTWFLTQDASIECSVSSREYLKLLCISITAISLYAVVMPLLVICCLRSKWSLRVRSDNPSVFYAFFGFLTSRYNHKCYMWELVVIVFKALSVIVPAIQTSSPAWQSLIMTVLSVAYTASVFSFSPFSNALINFVEKICLVCVSIMYFCAFVFTCEVNGAPVLNDSQRTFTGIFLCVICFFASVLCIFSSVYEYAFLLLFHKDMVISKWTQALQYAIGDCLEPFANLFLFFYVFYNPRVRSNVVGKKRMWNEFMAMQMIGDDDQLKGWRRCARNVKNWIKMIRFGMENSGILHCNPEDVKYVLKCPEARILKCFGKIEQRMLQKIAIDDDDDSGWSISQLWRKIAFWRKGAAVHPYTNHLGRQNEVSAYSDLDPPDEFVRIFKEQHSFITQSFSSSAISIWLTVMLFQERWTLEQTQQSMLYMRRLQEQLGSLTQSVQSTFLLVHDILHKEARYVDSNSEDKQSKWTQIIQSMHLGSEGTCLLRFSSMSYQDLADLMPGKGFEDFSRHSMHVFPVHMLIAAQREVNSWSLAKNRSRIRDKTASSIISGQQESSHEKQDFRQGSLKDENETSNSAHAKELTDWIPKPMYHGGVAHLKTRPTTPAAVPDKQRPQAYRTRNAQNNTHQSTSQKHLFDKAAQEESTAVEKLVASQAAIAVVSDSEMKHEDALHEPLKEAERQYDVEAAGETDADAKIVQLQRDLSAATEALAFSQAAAVATAPAPGRGEVALMRQLKEAERQNDVEAAGETDADAKIVQLQRDLSAATEALAFSQAAAVATAPAPGKGEFDLMLQLKEAERQLAVEAAGRADADAKIVQLQRDLSAATEALAFSQAAAVATAPAPGKGEVALMLQLKEAERQLAVEAAGRADADAKIVQLQRDLSAATEALAFSQAAAVATAPAPGKGEVALMLQLKEAERQLAVEAAGRADADAKIVQLQRELWLLSVESFASTQGASAASASVALQGPKRKA